MELEIDPDVTYNPIRRRPSSEPVRPFLSTMKDCDNFETVASQPVGNHVGRARHDQFPRADYSTRTAQIRKLGEPLNANEQRLRYSIGGFGVVARDICAQVREVLDRLWRPNDVHARGAFRSRLRPHERSHFATSLCGTERPASSSSSPA